jgi:hypothetical protein
MGTMDQHGHSEGDRPPGDLALGVAAVAELLARPAASIDELAARLGASRGDLEAALDHASVALLVVREPGGVLRAERGATSATLPRRARLALAPRPRRR